MTNTVDFINFGDVSRGRMGKQCQYGSRYIMGKHGYPKLGEGLRFENLDQDYHDYTIHKDDVEEFVRRYEICKAELNNPF